MFIGKITTMTIQTKSGGRNCENYFWITRSTFPLIGSIVMQQCIVYHSAGYQVYFIAQI